MIASIARHDLRICLRSGVFISLAIAMMALLIGATALSSQRLASFERERSAAEAVDRTVWDSQGERNPHSAAHFARYAFKPVSQLIAFDPGVTDYAGLAVWMEAHNQNPAVFRRAEDLGDAGRFADLSPAWLLQYIAPLFLFLILFSAMAGEREHGTLRQMAATGISSTAILWGKLMGAIIAIVLLLSVAGLLSLWAAGAHGAGGVPDGVVRGFGLAMSYTVYLVAAAAIAVGVSALCKEKRTALVALVGVWAISCVVIPRLAAGGATTFYPTPNAIQVAKALRDASSAPFRDDAYNAQLEKDVLRQYNVDSVEDLPISFNGYSLQASERYAEPLFEAVYGRLDGVYQQQENLIRAASLLSPVLAIEALSAGLAGTDRSHHRAFTHAAEQHRRVMIEQLNNDLTYNGAAAGSRYTSDETLWRTIADFDHQPPAFAGRTGGYTTHMLVLVFYLVASIVFARFAVRRAQRKVAS